MYFLCVYWRYVKGGVYCYCMCCGVGGIRDVFLMSILGMLRGGCIVIACVVGVGGIRDVFLMSILGEC